MPLGGLSTPAPVHPVFTRSRSQAPTRTVAFKCTMRNAKDPTAG